MLTDVRHGRGSAYSGSNFPVLMALLKGVDAKCLVVRIFFAVLFSGPGQSFWIDPAVFMYPRLRQLPGGAFRSSGGGASMTVFYRRK